MQFIGVGLGLMLVIKGEILIGTVVAAQSFSSDLASPLQDVIININSIKSVKEIVHKIELLSSDNQSNTNGFSKQTHIFEKMDIDRCDISFKDFGLQIGSKSIIEHFSFTFESGKKYLIVGLNGSGKSTLFKTLKKWYSLTDGSICINGTNISTLDSKAISKMVSYLNENVSLFSGSVKENITLFREFDSERFKHVIEDAQIRVDLNRETSDEGRNISSGEQRRIEIARSLFESVRVLIFDEIVSTLDIETAYEIEKMAMDFQEKTVIFISHNFSGKLVRKYDEILVMKDGKLLAHGKYDDLLNGCSYFKKICEIKFG